ncbi:hypothetical protein GCM10011505_36450 [Tistrella bauzanensis]|uniref:Nucleotidyltransferase family protein n=1 Tax=Tistrella bauzanensis TaxID=657419 RepID=A0ABQ1ITG7_9PROT|nr:hypothetical protein [Tistrella bauzanensis]GGB52134.1 hypothetical protein GCM10011505_36450 [Tistrella bauzanensis]
MTDDALRGGRTFFQDALLVLADASRRLEEAGIARPVLVGGAAVEFYTASHFVSGDFDIVIPSQAKLEAVLREMGFETPRDGTRGLHHYAKNATGHAACITMQRISGLRWSAHAFWMVRIL